MPRLGSRVRVPSIALKALEKSRAFLLRGEEYKLCRNSLKTKKEDRKKVLFADLKIFYWSIPAISFGIPEIAAAVSVKELQ